MHTFCGVAVSNPVEQPTIQHVLAVVCNMPKIWAVKGVWIQLDSRACVFPSRHPHILSSNTIQAIEHLASGRR